ncbi:TPA: hypothetical protein ACTYSZ_004965 [Klebsiella aerogenes]
MNRSTITRERLEQLANFKGAPVTRQEEKELARMALVAMDSEPVEWLNGCNKSVPAALRYLAENPRPIGGESSFNTAHLYQLAREIELMAEGTLYRHAQPAPVVTHTLADVFIAAIEKEQDRLHGEDYLMDSKDCIDVIREEALRLSASRAVMLQGVK